MKTTTRRAGLTIIEEWQSDELAYDFREMIDCLGLDAHVTPIDSNTLAVGGSDAVEACRMMGGVKGVLTWQGRTWHGQKRQGIIHLSAD